MSSNDAERQPLLQSNGDTRHGRESSDEQEVKFDDNDPDDPQQWRPSWKYLGVFQISLIAFFLPMSSSIYAPATDVIVKEYGTTNIIGLLGQSGFVCALGIGPLFLAPMSETFGRRIIYLLCLFGFTLLQIPIALAPDIATFIVFRTISGFFGSAAVGNGGGSISDMFSVESKAVALGIYMIFPLLAPTMGPLFGGLFIDRVDWRWISWFNMMLSGLTFIICYFFLDETRSVIILQKRQKELEKKHPNTHFWVNGASDETFFTKVASNSTRAVKILFTQPIVFVMSVYQALVFSTMYSLYAQYTTIWSEPPYEFTKTEVGLAYLSPAIGFIIAAVFIIYFTNKVHDYMAKRNGDKEGRPEYRLPLASIGAISLPVSLFWFGWTVEKDLSWPIPLTAMFFFGAAQVGVFNTVQTYYFDAFTQNAASALAAGAFLRSMVGGVVPLFVGPLFDQLGYGVGLSIFGGLAVVLMPAPLIFYYYGRQLREKYPFEG